MKLQETPASKVTWLFDMMRAQGDAYPPEVLEALGNRYKFLKIPKTIEEIAGKPTTFRMGKHGDCEIQELCIYNDGVIINSQVPTEETDAFLSDALNWLLESYGYEISEITPLRKLYQSELTVTMDFDLDQWLSPVRDIARKLSGLVTLECGKEQEYGASGLVLHFDHFYAPPGTPGQFRIERRVNEKYESNVYYSIAPLSTTKHMKLLGELEATAR